MQPLTVRGVGAKKILVKDQDVMWRQYEWRTHFDNQILGAQMTQVTSKFLIWNSLLIQLTSAPWIFTLYWRFSDLPNDIGTQEIITW